MILMHNIDPIRERIMELENAAVFNQRAWAQVLMQLSNSPCRRADAVRRMETAKRNAIAIMAQSYWFGWDMASGQDQTVTVAVETEE